MSKKRKNKKINYLLAIFALALIALGFLDAVSKGESDSYEGYTGFQVMFGKVLGSVNLGIVSGSGTISFSLLATVAYLLSIVGVVISFVLFKDKKLIGLTTLVCFVASAILLFMLPNITSLTIEGSLLGMSQSKVYTFNELDFGLGIGAIISAVISILGSVTSLYTIVK